MTLSAEKLFYLNPPICLIFDIMRILHSWSLMFKAVSLKYLQCRKKCFDKWAQRAHICLLMKCLQGISAFEKILSFHVLKRLWTPHSCISMSLFSSEWNVCHFFYQHPNSVYWKGINNTYNQKQKLNHEKSLRIMFHIFLSRWDVFCRKKNEPSAPCWYNLVSMHMNSDGQRSRKVDNCAEITGLHPVITQHWWCQAISVHVLTDTAVRLSFSPSADTASFHSALLII